MKTVKAVLVGGPADIPEEERNRTVTLTDRVKVPFGAGYEHFIHEGKFDRDGGEEVAVFHWSGRTKVAE